jgi:hypothetical protein
VSTKKQQNTPKAPVNNVQETPVPKVATTDLFDTIGSKAVFLVLGLLLFMAFIVYKDYLLFHNAYYFKDIGSDSYNYSYAVTYGVADYMSKHGLPQWSFGMSMGQNMFPFFLRDPFDIFLYLSGKDSIIFGTAYKEFAKVVLSGLVFFYYLRSMGLAAFTSIVGSLFYAFCAFMILGGGWFLFSFETFNLAVLLLGFELLFSKGKWLVFTLGIFLIFLSQPFNMYVYGLFLAGYAILRMVQTGGYDVKSGALLFGKMAGAGVLGILLSGPFMLENVVQLLESPRGSGNTSYAGVLSSVPMFSTVDQFQLGTAIMRFFSSDLLGSGSNFKGWQNTLEAPLFYCGLPCLLLMPQVFPFLTKKVRLFFIVFLAIWLMPIIFPYFRYAFWLFTGDYYRAYSIVVAMFLMYYALLALDKIITHRKINLVILIATVAFLFLLLNYPFFPDGGVINSPVFTFVCFLLLVYSGIIFMLGRENSPAYMKYLLLGVIVFELTYMSGITVNDRDPVTAEELTEKKGYNDYTADAVKFISSKDNSFYRIDKSYASSPAIHYSLNDAQAQGYRGTCGYNPFNQLYYIRYLQLVGVSDKKSELDSRWARGLMGRPILESANRVKYMLAKQDVVPLWRLIGDSIATFGDVKVFRNKFLLPFGYTYKQYIRESVYDALSTTQKDFITLKACVVSDEDVAKVKGMTEYQLRDTIAPSMFNLDMYAQSIADLGRDSLVADKITDTRISGKVNVSEDKMLYLSVPYDGGWKLKVDGQEKEKEIVFAGMTGVFLGRGQHTVEMVYDLRYFNKGLLMSVAGIVLCIVLWFLTRNKAVKPSINSAE